MDLRAWAMARKDGLSLGLNGGTVVLAVAALLVSVVSTVGSLRATEASQIAAEAAQDSVELAREANQLSLEQAKLQGAVPGLLLPEGVTDPNESSAMFLESEETGSIDVLELQVSNSGLSDTNLTLVIAVSLLVPEVPEDILATNCVWVAPETIELPAQSIIRLDRSFECPVMLNEDPNPTPANIRVTLRFGTGQVTTIERPVTQVLGVSSGPDI